jgi:hypothetical protein
VAIVAAALRSVDKRGAAVRVKDVIDETRAQIGETLAAA